MDVRELVGILTSGDGTADGEIVLSTAIEITKVCPQSTFVHWQSAFRTKRVTWLLRTILATSRQCGHSTLIDDPSCFYLSEL